MEFPSATVFDQPKGKAEWGGGGLLEGRVRRGHSRCRCCYGDARLASVAVRPDGLLMVERGIVGPGRMKPTLHWAISQR